jgi:hypothetical protein
VEPGSSETTLTVRLNPASLRNSNPLTIQLDVLGADSGFAIDPESAVAGVSMGDKPQAHPYPTTINVSKQNDNNHWRTRTD